MKVFIGPYSYLMEEEHRNNEVEIHDYDVWSLDHTLAKIIYPALLKFRDSLLSYPVVDDEDAPDGEQLNGAYSHESQAVWKGQVADDPGYARWLWVLDEMIFSFHCLYTDGAWEDELFQSALPDDPSYAELVTKAAAIEERISNGFRLFGKYYRALWN